MNVTKTFFYKAPKKSFLNFLVWLMLMAIPFGCIISFVGSAVISTFVEKLFSFELPEYTMFILWPLFLIGVAMLGFRDRLLFLSMDADNLQVQNVWQKPVEINRNEIHASDFDKKGRLILNDTILINPKGLPLKKRIELGMFLPEWLPEEMLPPDQKEYLQWKRQLQQQQETMTNSQTAQTAKKHTTLLRGISLVGLSFFAGMVLWLIFSGTIRESLAAMIPIGALVLLLFFSIWGSTVFKKFQVDEKGITYQFGKKEIFCRWSEIEVIAFRVAAQRLLIWDNGNRYKSYSYHQIDAERMNEVAEAIFEQAAIRNIPMAKV